MSGPLDRLPIVSHWGITGGDFYMSGPLDPNLRQVDLSFVQSDFKNLYEIPTPYHREVIERSGRLLGSRSLRHDDGRRLQDLCMAMTSLVYL